MYRDDYNWVWVCVVMVIVLISSLLVMGDIDPKCESGHHCVKCACAGNYGRLIPEEEPDNPDNKKWPRHRCTNFCTRTCCKCVQAEA